MSINAKYIRALERAVAIVRSERYNRIGNPDPEPLAAFDQDLRLMEEALSRLRQANITPVRGWQKGEP